MARSHIQNQAAKKPEDTTQETPGSETEGNDTANADSLEESTPGIQSTAAGMEDPRKHSAVVAQRPNAPRARQYEVVNQRDVPVLYNGCHSTMRPGKIIDDTAYDLDVLRRQGVKLQEITPDSGA